MVRPLAAPGPQVRDNILENPQRADDRAIHPAEDEGEDRQAHDDRHIDGQDGGQQLQLGHPAQVQVQYPREIQQQQGDSYEEHTGQHDSDTF